MTLIVRVYDSEKKARDAAKKLKADGFGDVLVLAPKAGGEGAAKADYGRDVADAVRGGRFPRASSRMAADSLQKGRAVLCVDAPYGAGKAANEIVESFGPMEVKEQAEPFDFNSGLTSDAFNVPLLQDGYTLANWFGGLLKSSDYTFSSFLNLALVTDDPAPLSSRLRLSVLSDPKKPYTVGEPTLLSDPAPLSTRFRFDVLSKPKKDWTQSFGRPLLMKNNPTPLSDRLGWSVLSKNS